MSKREQVIDFIREHSVVRPKDLTDVGLPRDYLYQLAQEGVIERVGRGVSRQLTCPVEQKIRRHLAKSRQRRGFGWKRWSRRWMYDALGLFDDYRVRPRCVLVGQLRNYR